MGLEQELQIVRSGFALYRPPTSFFQVEGPDATSYLNRMLTNEVLTCPIGEGRHQALLDRKGMVLSLFYLFRKGENLYQGIAPPEVAEKTLNLLSKYKITEKLEVRDCREEWGIIQVIGPKAEVERQDHVWCDGFYKIPVWNVVYHKQEGLPSLPYPEISKAAFDILRMESGIPEYGIDIDESHLLLEANLAHCYKRQKGCYPGQEVIERILAYGRGRTPRILKTLWMEGEHQIPAKAEVIRDGIQIGQVTSSLYNPLERKTIVLAYVDFRSAEDASWLRPEGTRYFLVSGGPDRGQQ